MEKGFEEFMEKVSELGKTEEEKTHVAITKDGHEVKLDEFDAIMCMLSECAPNTLKEIGEIEFFKTLTKNFISTITFSDLCKFIRHRVMIKLTNIITKQL